MRYLLLALLSCLLLAGCELHGGYGASYGYTYYQPIPVYYSNTTYIHPHHYYHGQVVITPHFYYRGGVRGRRR